jgi:hypothetical protein
MKTLCQRNENNVCTQCGEYRPPGEFFNCPKKNPGVLRPAPKEATTAGLGELVGEFFSLFGVTEERYKNAKAAVGLDPACGCSERKAWLDAVGESLGINSAADDFAHWLKQRCRK